MTTRTEKIDHSVFPEIVDRESGEVLTQEYVDAAYTREGRRVVGKEYPNPVPLMAPIGFREQEPIWEQIRRMVRGAMSEAAAADDMETEEEANDFDVGDDDFDPFSPWEEQFEPTQPWPARPEVQAAEEAVVAANASTEPAADPKAD